MTITIKKITVSPESANTRLDVFLSAELKISRSQAQKMINHEQILVNGKLPKKMGERIRAGGVIEISNIQYLISNQITKTKTQTPRELKFVSITPDYIVIDKPTGLLTHPTAADEPSAVSKILLKKYPELKKVRDLPLVPSPPTGEAGLKRGENLRPGIVHRLDKDASGLLAVARTPKMFECLKEQFKNRTVAKEYVVLVHGRVAKDWDEINFPLTRSKTSDRMASIPLTYKGMKQDEAKPHTDPQSGSGVWGKQAKTEFWVEKRFVNFTLLRVKIHTGRMHQIRAHFLAYNHPVVGDPLYFQKKNKRKWDAKLGRLFLHCTKLGFTDLKGVKQTFESPLPTELDKFLKLLK